MDRKEYLRRESYVSRENTRVSSLESTHRERERERESSKNRRIE